MQRSPTTSDGSRTEMGWIEWIGRRAARGSVAGAAAETGKSPLRLGIGDDCAIVSPAGGDELLVTTDFTLEGRHFRRDWHTPESAGHRALARGLSDLAAMGARPVAAFLSLALPLRDARDPAWAERFLEGLLALAERFGVPLGGGDTAQAPGEELLADIVLLGAAPAGTALRRSGARPGDGLYVTGSLGGAAAELASLDEPAGQPGLPASGASGELLDGCHPQLYPEPRVQVGEELRRRGFVTACMDLSDGLSTDLGHLCSASAVAAAVSLELLPASFWLAGYSRERRERFLLHGGEDYELLFTAGPEAVVPGRVAGVPVTRIGSILPGQGSESQVMLRSGDMEEPLRPGGWEHLRG